MNKAILIKEIDEYINKNDDDEYGIRKIYNYGTSERYNYRKKKYNMKTNKIKVQSEKNKIWMEHVKYIRENNPHLDSRSVLQLASKTYKKPMN